MSNGIILKETEIGLIPEDWKIKKIKDVCEQVRESFSPNDEDIRPYLGLEHINEGSLTLNEVGNSSDVKSGKLVFHRGQILFGKLRPYFRKVYRPNFDGVCSTDIFVIDKKENNDNGFLFYFFANPFIIDIATQSSEGTKMPRASWSYLSNLKFAFPPLHEQKTIGKYLSVLDQKIHLNHQMNQILEEISKTIFRQWFVHFEFPTSEGRPYKSGGGEMVDSELGKIPKGWEIKDIEELTLKRNQGINTTTEKVEYSQLGIPVIRAKNIIEHDITYDDLAYVDRSTFLRIKDNHKPKKGDILYTNIGSHFGNAAIVQNDKPFTIAWNVLRLQINQQIMTPEYLCYLLNDPFHKLRIKSYNSSSTMPFVSGKEFAKIKFIIPPIFELIKANEIIDSLNNLIELNKAQINNLIKIRDSILPKLMSGKIRITPHKEAAVK